MTRVVQIEVAHWNRQLRETMTISRGGFRERNHVFVKCTSDSGHFGFGEAVGDWRRIYSALQCGIDFEPLLDTVIDAPKDVWGLLLGDDVYVESLGSTWAAVSAVEMALTDLESSARVPAPDSGFDDDDQELLETYASNIYWDHPDRMAEVARRIVERGIRAIKVHIGVGSPIEELPRLRAIREAIGSQTLMMVDLNCGYSVQEAVEAGQLWEDLGIHWLEEPIHPSDWAGLETVSSKVPMQIAVGENLGWPSEFRRAIDCGAQTLMPDAGRVGMFRCREVDELCTYSAATYSPHNYSSGLLLGATVALLRASAQPGPLEVDLSGNSLYEELWGPLQFDVMGRLQIPAGSGGGLLPEGADSILNKLAWRDVSAIDMLSP